MRLIHEIEKEADALRLQVWDRLQQESDPTARRLLSKAYDNVVVVVDALTDARLSLRQQVPSSNGY